MWALCTLYTAERPGTYSEVNSAVTQLSSRFDNQTTNRVIQSVDLCNELTAKCIKLIAVIYIKRVANICLLD